MGWLFGSTPSKKGKDDDKDTEQVSRVQLRNQGGEGKGSSYSDNKDGTIHVTHYDNNIRESYDVPYGKDADDVSNSVPDNSGNDSYHVVKNR